MVGERHLLVKWQFLGSLLWKAKERDASAADAKRALESGLKHLSEGRALEALDDFTVARFHRNWRQEAVALLAIASADECRLYTSFRLRYNYSW
jgi:hypothetical protein